MIYENHDAVRVTRSADKRTITVRIRGEYPVIFGASSSPVILHPDGGLVVDADLLRRACLAVRAMGMR